MPGLCDPYYVRRSAVPPGRRPGPGHISKCLNGVLGRETVLISQKRSTPVSLLKKSRSGALIAGSVFALGLGGVVFAAPASAASDNCSEWNDSQTVGYSCQGDSSFYAWAQCQDGTPQYGAIVGPNDGEVSYAYCSGDGGLSYWGYQVVSGG
jgi:hypothetical protein